jgi:DNA-binding CsgD family transcriptional regulator
MELLGVIGFSLMLGWFFPTFFWFFVSETSALGVASVTSASSVFGAANVSTELAGLTLPAADFATGDFMGSLSPIFATKTASVFFSVENTTASSARLTADICLTLLFIGMPLGNVLIRFLALRLKARFHYRNTLLIATVIAAALPLLVLAKTSGVAISDLICYCASLLAGMSMAWFITSWLDVCGKTRIRNILIFTTASYAGGSLLFFLCAMMPPIAQPIACDIFLLLSLVLLFYMSSRSNANEIPTVASRTEFLTSPREVEPSFVTLGIAFGIGFVLLFSQGSMAIMVAILVVLLAAALMMTLAVLNLRISVVLLLRILIVFVVGDFLLLAIAPNWLWIVASCAIAGIWVVFTTANSANLVKLVLERNLPVFYHVPSGLVPAGVGFSGGWLVAMVLLHLGLGQTEVSYILLATVFLIVLSSMIFYPEKKHHDTSASHASDFIVRLSASNSSEDDIFVAKCSAVAKLYQLSPRETDVLMHLVRGRNAEYIRKKLVVSAHTVKSHIYSIYLKTDIHSQQKLMDLIEEFVVETDKEK